MFLSGFEVFMGNISFPHIVTSFVLIHPFPNLDAIALFTPAWHQYKSSMMPTIDDLITSETLDLARFLWYIRSRKLMWIGFDDARK